MILSNDFARPATQKFEFLFFRSYFYGTSWLNKIKKKHTKIEEI